MRALKAGRSRRRTRALVAMLPLIEINGRRVHASDRELADWIISFSRGTTPEDVAALIRQRFLPDP